MGNHNLSITSWDVTKVPENVLAEILAKFEAKLDYYDIRYIDGTLDVMALNVY